MEMCMLMTRISTKNKFSFADEFEIACVKSELVLWNSLFSKLT